MGSIGRPSKRLASLTTFTNPLVTTQVQAQQQAPARKLSLLSQFPQQLQPPVDPFALTHNGDSGAIATCHEAEPRRDTEMGSDNDSEVCDLALDGALEDEILKNADALTEQEVARRRLRRVRQLLKLYRMHYWGLLEELRSKYRVFYIKYGKGGWRDDVEADKESAMESLDAMDKAGHPKEPVVLENPGAEMVGCASQGCKAKPMALSSFCFSHILLEPHQKLYRPCSFVTKSGQSGSVTCGKPVLRSLVPLHCPSHVQKPPSRGVRKANSNVAPKAGPKLHLVIAEYVRLIQCKRRAARDAALKNATGVGSGKEVDGAGSAMGPQDPLHTSVAAV